MKKKIKLVAIAKDEARYLTEWIFHHAKFGFDEFDIYINNTTDNSREILTKLACVFKINIIEADELFKQNHGNFQSAAYQNALNTTDKEKFSHIAFFDIDEFWTPKDFSTSIHDYLSHGSEFDVCLFNWGIHRSEQEFTPCYAKANSFAFDSHVKSVVKLDKLMKAEIHNVIGSKLTYANADFKNAEFEDDSKAKVIIQRDKIPAAFIVHRLYRSQLEYVSMLSRGRPSGAKFKSNRTGYYAIDSQVNNFFIDDDLVNAHYRELESLICQLELENLIIDAEKFVLTRYENIFKAIDQGLEINDAQILIKAFDNINIPKVHEYKKKLLARLSPAKIFQIGFNKAGTASIYHYLRTQGYKAVHWDNGNLSKTIQKNHQQGNPLLKGYEDFQVFTDMEHREANKTAFYSAEVFFKELDQQYPNSIFILNYRDRTKWLESRLNHPGYLEKTMQSLNLDCDQVLELWKKEFDHHIEAVKEYFKHKNNLILLDLDKDDKQKLYRELTARNILLTKKDLPHSHKTNTQYVEEKQKHLNAIRDAALYFKFKDIESSMELMKIANRLKPHKLSIKSKLKAFTKTWLFNVRH